MFHTMVFGDGALGVVIRSWRLNLVRRDRNFNFNEIRFFFLCIMLLVWSLRTLCLILDPKIFLCLFPKSFIVLCFTFMPIIHLSPIQSVRFRSSFISLYWFIDWLIVYGCPISPASFVKRLSFPPVDIFCNFVKSQLGIFVWVYFWVSYAITFKVILLC